MACSASLEWCWAQWRKLCLLLRSIMAVGLSWVLLSCAHPSHALSFLHLILKDGKVGSSRYEIMSTSSLGYRQEYQKFERLIMCLWTDLSPQTEIFFSLSPQVYADTFPTWGYYQHEPQTRRRFDANWRQPSNTVPATQSSPDESHRKPPPCLLPATSSFWSSGASLNAKHQVSYFLTIVNADLENFFNGKRRKAPSRTWSSVLAPSSFPMLPLPHQSSVLEAATILPSSTSRTSQ